MKQNFITIAIYTLLAGCFVFLNSCNDDEKVDGAAPDILFHVETLKVDLNTASRPAVISVVNSDVGLKSVSAYILKTGETEQLIDEPVTSFTNPNSYSLNAAVTFTEDMTGFKVTALDRNGQESIKILNLDITPLRDPPVVIYNSDESLEQISYREGDAMPALSFRVSSEEELNYVVISQVVNRVETIIQVNGQDSILFTEGEKIYNLDMISALSYSFPFGITALKVSVGAGPVDNMKLKVATLYIDYIEVPAPVITFDNTDDEIELMENTSLTITGKIYADGKANMIQFFTRDANDRDTEIAGSSIPIIPSAKEHNFSIHIPSVEAGSKGVVVVVEDDLNKSTSAVKKLNVIELVPAPAINLTTTSNDANGLDNNAPFSLVGSVTSLGVITEVKVIVTDNQGTETDYPVSISDVTNVDLSTTSITTTSTMSKIRVEATDENGKKSVSPDLDMHVGYSYHRVLVSSSGFQDASYEYKNYSDPNLLPYFSAAKVQSYGYVDAAGVCDVIDIGFTCYSTQTRLAVFNVPGGYATNKFNYGDASSPYRAGNWASQNVVYVKFTTSINRNNFETSTIDDIMEETLSTSGGGDPRYLTTGSFATPDNVAIIYQTPINGENKRVVFCYDELEKPLSEAPATPGTRFYIKVKIQK